MNISSVAIIGNGQFGVFMGEWLSPHVAVHLLGRADGLSVVGEVDAVIFAVPFVTAEVRPPLVSCRRFLWSSRVRFGGMCGCGRIFLRELVRRSRGSNF